MLYPKMDFFQYYFWLLRLQLLGGRGRGGLADTGQPIVGSLNQDLSLNLFPRLELLKLLLVLDGIFHGHRGHPALDLLTLDCRELRGRIYADDLAAHLIFNRGLGRRLLAAAQKKNCSEQKRRLHLVNSAVLLAADFVTSLEGGKRSTLASAGTPLITVPAGS